MLRRLETLVHEARCGAWIKLVNGRFLAFSDSFGAEVGVPPQNARRFFDRDFFAGDEVERFQRDDEWVLRTRRPGVVVEPPDLKSPCAWAATLKIPVFDGAGQGAATLAFSYPLDRLEPLKRIVRARRRNASPADRNALPDRLRARLDQLFQERFMVSDLASYLGCHPDHLARRFRKSYGVTIAQYVAAKRVAWAATRLSETAQPLAEIAIGAGFYDQSHLTRTFQQVLGTTPARYRRTTRERNETTWRGPRLALELACKGAWGGSPAS